MTERARTEWDDAPEHPAYERQIPPARRRHRHEQRGGTGGDRRGGDRTAAAIDAEAVPGAGRSHHRPQEYVGGLSHLRQQTSPARTHIWVLFAFQTYVRPFFISERIQANENPRQRHLESDARDRKEIRSDGDAPVRYQCGRTEGPLWSRHRARPQRPEGLPGRPAARRSGRRRLPGLQDPGDADCNGHPRRHGPGPGGRWLVGRGGGLPPARRQVGKGDGAGSRAEPGLTHMWPFFAFPALPLTG